MICKITIELTFDRPRDHWPNFNAHQMLVHFGFLHFNQAGPYMIIIILTRMFAGCAVCHGAFLFFEFPSKSWQKKKKGCQLNLSRFARWKMVLWINWNSYWLLQFWSTFTGCNNINFKLMGWITHMKVKCKKMLIIILGHDQLIFIWRGWNSILQVIQSHDHKFAPLRTSY